MRLFIAINLSDAMKDALTAAQEEMYDRGVRGKHGMIYTEVGEIVKK